MDIGSALAGAVGYSHRAGKDQAAQQHLWNIPRQPPAEFPLGLKTRVSGSGQSLPLIPWIALLNPDVTTTATDGLYLVYLYNHDVDTVYLSMNQGATQHKRQAEDAGLTGKAAETAALAEIGAETQAIRDLLDPSMLAAAGAPVALGANSFLPRAYEQGSIAARTYDLAALPANETLASDLADFVTLYARCVELKDELAANRRVRTSARSAKKRTAPPKQPVFKPKNSSDYVANVGAANQRRSRTHEALIEAFGNDVLATGRIAATNVHPRDMTIDDGGVAWLVEAKTVGANAEIAVREAIGQLYSYRHFHYREAGVSDPKLLALFSAPIGEAFEQLLGTLGIEYVCRDGGSWRGSSAAIGLSTNL